MKEEIQILSAEDAIRKRPGMYLGSVGSKGLINLVKGILLDSIDELKSEDLFFHFTIISHNNYQISITSISEFTEVMLNPTTETKHIRDNFHFSVLKALSQKLKINQTAKKNLLIKWSFDQKAFPIKKVDFVHLNEMATQIAYLHRQSEILISDKSGKYLNQSFFSYPEGIRYIYERCKVEAFGTPKFEIKFEGGINDNEYQIFLGYRTDWYPTPQIVSFANEIHTIFGGSLVDGILEGLISGCRKHVKDSKLENHKIKKKKFNNGLILVCAVKGQDLIYAGSFKESLFDDKIRKDVKKIIKLKTLEFINQNEEKANKFLWRFDETQLTSGIM